MINLVLPNILRFFGLILIQVLVVSNFNLSYYINPYIYLLFILALPFRTPNWILMLVAFVTGLILDTFMNTIGIHAAACVFVAFLRPSVMRILTPKGSYEGEDMPRIGSLGFTWYLAYTSILVFSHHVLYFYLEIFSLDSFFSVFGKVILSSIFSITIILLLVIMFSPGKKGT